MYMYVELLSTLLWEGTGACVCVREGCGRGWGT